MAHTVDPTIRTLLAGVFAATNRPLSVGLLAFTIDAPKADVEKTLATMVENNEIDGPIFQVTTFCTAKS